MSRPTTPANGSGQTGRGLLRAGGAGGAVPFAETNEDAWKRDILATDPGQLRAAAGQRGDRPDAPARRPNGLVLRGGRIVARWGDTRRVDMTFSVAKSYLSMSPGSRWPTG